MIDEMRPYTKTENRMNPEVVLFTDEWTPSEPEWATVLRCPRCHNLVDNDEADCRKCGLAA